MAYRQAERTDRDRLSQELASRILEITGQSVDAGSISVDPGTRTATVPVGDVVFQLRQTALFLVRPCVRCGVGRFTSGAIACAVDLGHALAVWEPRCAGCAFDDEDEDWSHSFCVLSRHLPDAGTEPDGARSGSEIPPPHPSARDAHGARRGATCPHVLGAAPPAMPVALCRLPCI